MSGPEFDGALPPPDLAAVPPRPFFRPWATWLATILAAGLVGHLYVLTPGGPLDRLHRPEDSLERLTEREMDVRAALRHATPWERRLYALLSGGDESVDDWIRWHEELAEVSTSLDVEISLLILLGETRQTEALRTALGDWEGNDAAETRRKDWIAAAYLEPSLSRAEGRALITEVRDELPAGWFADALVARLARRSGDAVARQQAESAIAARGSALLRRWRALEAAGLLLGVAGLAALGLMVLTQADPRVADARVPDGFSLADGYALFIRGALGFLVLGAGLGVMIPDDSALDALTGPATVAPILLYAAWYLRSRGLSFAAAYGLLPGRDRLVTIAWVALALVGLQLAGESLIGAALDALRLSSHWADGLEENLMWGSWGLVARKTTGSVLWAPLGEEVAFRGVLYPALRSRFGVAPAAALSAAVFAVAHGYGVLGFAVVFWSGILWALAYERTGSLWPCIVAHAAGNLGATVGVVALLR
ncbi:MAG: CPBP family intramembrane metalloprotease [Candidatus Rokubacteria bacterium]|nr:CPBP family intramembrane metalloprotease [Candidatus Rokubacteria bacterium]